MYYLCTENKDADQLGGYREADLHLCFRICKMMFFHDAAHTVPPSIFEAEVIRVTLVAISTFCRHILTYLKTHFLENGCLGNGLQMVRLKPKKFDKITFLTV